jgi:hypothetical protein
MYFPIFRFSSFLFLFLFFLTSLRLNFFAQNHLFLVSRPPLPEEGPIPVDLASAASEAPEAEENQDEDDAKESLEGTSSTTSPPPAHSEDPSLDRKRKRVEEFLSSSTSTRRMWPGRPLF